MKALFLFIRFVTGQCREVSRTYIETGCKHQKSKCAHASNKQDAVSSVGIIPSLLRKIRKAILVSKENSQRLKLFAWEIMRRYSSFLNKSNPTKSQGHNTTLGDARWGDAKRVEAIFGIKRGVLIRLSEDVLIKSIALGENNGATPTTRAKRLYCLVSIAEYLESKK